MHVLARLVISEVFPGSHEMQVHRFNSVTSTAVVKAPLQELGSHATRTQFLG